MTSTHDETAAPAPGGALDASAASAERAPHLKPSPASSAALQLGRASNDELERVFLRGVMPQPRELVGWTFRGLNTPWWASLLGIRKFIKGFCFDRDERVLGYNCPVVQGPLGDPWRARPLDHDPKRFGFYTVTPVDPVARDNAYLHAVLLNYGEGPNPALDPTRGLRDYVVQVAPNDPTLLLGKAYYALGPARVATNFFVLERDRPGPVVLDL